MKFIQINRRASKIPHVIRADFVSMISGDTSVDEEGFIKISLWGFDPVEVKVGNNDEEAAKAVNELLSFIADANPLQPNMYLIQEL